jgi:hypothetical protein
MTFVKFFASPTVFPFVAYKQHSKTVYIYIYIYAYYGNLIFLNCTLMKSLVSSVNLRAER